MMMGFGRWEGKGGVLASYSITSSARAANPAGMSRPSAFAVLRLITTLSRPLGAGSQTSRFCTRLVFGIRNGRRRNGRHEGDGQPV
jgi:hypothetical protein